MENQENICLKGAKSPTPSASGETAGLEVQSVHVEEPQNIPEVLVSQPSRKHDKTVPTVKATHGQEGTDYRQQMLTAQDICAHKFCRCAHDSPGERHDCTGKSACHIVWASFQTVLYFPCMIVDFFQICIACLCSACKWDSFAVTSPKCDMLLEAESDEFLNAADMIEIWDARDIKWDESDNYLSSLEVYLQSHDNQQTMENEITEVCTKNYPNRMKSLCEHLGFEYLSTLMPSQTPLHAALLHNSAEVAKVLIKRAPAKFLSAKMEDEEVCGITALHIAVANADRDTMFLLLTHLGNHQDPVCTKQALLHTRATGPFFNGPFPTAELPLNLATWIGDTALVTDLLKYGVSLDEVDSKGNTVFHTLVHVADKKPKQASKMYSIILRHVPRWWARQCKSRGETPNKAGEVAVLNHLLRIQNNKGLTPIKLAAQKGTLCMLTQILNTENVYRFTDKRFGPMLVAAYEMSEVDPILAQNQASPSVLELLVSDDEGVESLKEPVIAKLINMKWFNNRHYFITWAIIYIQLMACFTYITAQFSTFGYNSFCNTTWIIQYTPEITNSQLIKNDTNSTLSHDKTAFHGLFKYVLFWATLFVVYGMFGIVKMIQVIVYRWRSDAGKTLFGRVIFQYIYAVVLATLIFLHYIFVSYCTSKQSLEITSALVLVVGWAYVIFFTTAFRPTGFFTVMFSRLLQGDLPRFLLIFLILAAAFGFALRATFTEGIDKLPREFKTNPIAMLSMVRLTLGLNDLHPIYTSPMMPIRIILYICFVLLVNILLLNMLIATMTDAYNLISKYRDILWFKLQALDMIILEYMLPCWLQIMATEAYCRRKVKVQNSNGEMFSTQVYLMDVQMLHGDVVTDQLTRSYGY